MYLVLMGDVVLSEEYTREDALFRYIILKQLGFAVRIEHRRTWLGRVDFSA